MEREWLQGPTDLDAANEEVIINFPAAGVVSFQISGTFTATITFAGSIDQTNWISMPAINLGTLARATTTTDTGIFVVQAAGLRLVRARITSYTSGTATVSALAQEQAVDAAAFAPTGGGVVDTELPAAAALSDTMGNLTVPSVGAALLGFDGTNFKRNRTITEADGLATTFSLCVQARQFAWNGASFDRVRTPNVFKTVALSSGTTETTIWTPAASRKFRLMGFLLTCGAASTLTFKDNTAGTTIFITRGATDQPISPGQGMGNGILSAAVNNVLTITRGTACTLDGVVWGTEEA